MLNRLNFNNWQSLAWWLPVSTLTLYLKYHYSIAEAGDLQWMLQPLCELIELVTGYEFQQDSNGEWFSHEADVHLVNSCAGINFMLMSLLAYAWVFRPDAQQTQSDYYWLAGHLILIATILLAAWTTALLANALRILLAMALQTDDSVITSLGLSDDEVHRYIGLAVYLPILSLQLLADKKRTSPRQLILIPVLLYVLTMVLIPLLTGNALLKPGLFFTHIIQLGAGIAFIQGLIFMVVRKRV